MRKTYRQPNTNLFDYIAKNAGFDFVTEIRNPRNYGLLKKELFKCECYDVMEWENLAYYITGTKCSFSNTKEGLKFMEHFLEKTAIV